MAPWRRSSPRSAPGHGMGDLMDRKLDVSIDDDGETEKTQTVRRYRQRRRVRRPGRLTLRVLDGPQTGAEAVVERTRVRVGRSRAADVVIDHPSLSALHFELRFTRHGVELFDLASKNGTSILGHRVFHALVHPGDVITAGDCRVELVATQDISVEQCLEAREDGLLGISDGMREIFALIERAAPSSLPVLVGGETGTGKELVARAIHRHSDRSAGPFVVLDCSTLPPALAESGILGHCKGAFTGADADRPGAFEAAHGGTLFLDEVGEIPLSLQPKLLRALDRREVMRVGEHTPRSVDVRLVAATHRNLPRMVGEGFFREDLYHRITVMALELPALRDRGSAEIEYLAKCFLANLNARQRMRLEWSNEALAALAAHSWPGNVRELVNVTNRASILCTPPTIRAADLLLRPSASGHVDIEKLIESGDYEKIQREIDLRIISKILEETGGSVSETARRLGLGRKLLISKITSLGLRHLTRGHSDSF
jgi:DNA-binding NtrC family response regulator